MCIAQILYIWSTHNFFFKKLCLEIPGCVQHKVMYGVALWRDRSHYMDHMDRTHHNVEMLVTRR